jgi:hypothetical protein
LATRTKATRTKTPPPASSDPVRLYAEDVIAGRVVAGPWVRLACQRHLDDLRDGPARGLVWSLEHALRAIEFFEEVLHLNGGTFEGKPFLLLAWQKFCIGSIFAFAPRTWRSAKAPANPRSPPASACTACAPTTNRAPRFMPPPRRKIRP